MKSLLLVPLAGLLLGAAPAARANDMEQAMQYYENGQYVRAEDRLRAAARAGDGRAAEILGFMYAFGPALYPGIQRDVRSAIHWFDIAARNGRPTGRYMVCALRKQVGDTAQRGGHCFDWIAETGQPAPR